MRLFALGPRLAACAKLVRPGCRIADIGTDHGYVAIESLRDGRISRAILCDKNERPLRRAEGNILALGLSDYAQTRLGDGLAPLKPNEADCISIAGIGGMLMIGILQNGADLLCTTQRLVLQPQSDIHNVRKHVHLAGFKICNERMIFEGRFYTIIRCERGRDTEYSDVEYLLGKCLIERKDAVLKQYLQYRVAECERILRAHEVAEVIKDKNMCGEVLACL